MHKSAAKASVGSDFRPERGELFDAQFIRLLSHELRAPLNNILGWCRLLAEGNASLEQALPLIERSANAQRNLLDDLSDLSQIRAGKLQVRLQQVESASLILASIEAHRPAASDKSLQLKTSLSKTSCLIYADLRLFPRALSHLLHNGIKYTPKGGTVEVSLRRDGNNAEICVRDTGRGIDPKLIPHLFEPFNPADSGSFIRNNHGGLGLGLALAKQISDLHGARIEARSAGIGQGAEFMVTLPCCPLSGS